MSSVLSSCLPPSLTLTLPVSLRALGPPRHLAPGLHCLRCDHVRRRLGPGSSFFSAAPWWLPAAGAGGGRWRVHPEARDSRPQGTAEHPRWASLRSCWRQQGAEGLVGTGWSRPQLPAMPRAQGLSARSWARERKWCCSSPITLSPSPIPHPPSPISPSAIQVLCPVSLVES